MTSAVERDPGTAADAVTRARSRATTVALVDGPADRAALYDAFADALGFPSSFGRNLDALEDALRDLSWLPTGPVEVVWADGPLAEADPRLHEVVLAILRDAVVFKGAFRGEEHPLRVVLAG